MYLRRRTKRLISFGLLLAAVVAWLHFSGIAARSLEAVAVLRDVMAVGAPKEKDGSSNQRREVTYTVDGRPYVADIYQPVYQAPRAALILLPGAAQTGKDDDLLVGFAEVLARAGFLVFAPDNPDNRRLMVSAGDSQGVADAVTYLTEEARVPKVAVAAVSYATGPALLAALRPDINDKVALIVTIGGYYDMTALLTYFTTGFYRETGAAEWSWQEPNAYGKWVFVQANAARVGNLGDQTALLAIAQRKLKNRDAEVYDLVDILGPEGWSLLALIENGDPEAVAGLREALPEGVRRELEGLDLSRADVSRLKAQLLLVHGQGDQIIPYTQSLALADAVPAGQASAYIVGNLMHARLTPGGVLDGFRLWRAVYALLGARDALPAPKG